MGHTVKRAAPLPLPEARVVYEPEYQVLDIYNGRPSEVGEEMARGIHVMYDVDFDDAPTSAVTILVTSAESVLKPFVDAILAKHGIPPVPELGPLPEKGYRETVITQPNGEGWALAPFSKAVYDAASQTLLIENGEAREVSREMAKDVHVLYGKDYAGGDGLASVAIRIDRAETVLQPFVQAILAKYAVKTKENTQEQGPKLASSQPIPEQ